MKKSSWKLKIKVAELETIEYKILLLKRILHCASDPNNGAVQEWENRYASR